MATPSVTPAAPGSVTRAAQAIRAPRQGSSIGDFSTAVGGFLHGHLEEKKRQEEKALREAMLALQERQVAVQEESLGLQREQHGESIRQFDISSEQTGQQIDIRRMEVEDLGQHRDWSRGFAEQAVDLEAQRFDNAGDSYRHLLHQYYGVPQDFLDRLDPQGLKAQWDALQAQGLAQTQAGALTNSEALRAAQLLVTQRTQELETYRSMAAEYDEQVAAMTSDRLQRLTPEEAQALAAQGLDPERLQGLIGTPRPMLPDEVRVPLGELLFQSLHPEAAGVRSQAKERIGQLSAEIQQTMQQLQGMIGNPASMMMQGPLVGGNIGQQGGRGAGMLHSGGQVGTHLGSGTEPPTTWSTLQPQEQQEQFRMFMGQVQDPSIGRILWQQQDHLLGLEVPLAEIVEAAMGVTLEEWGAAYELAEQNRGVQPEMTGPGAAMGAPGLQTGIGTSPPPGTPTSFQDAAAQRGRAAGEVVENVLSAEDKEYEDLIGVLNGRDPQAITMERLLNNTVEQALRTGIPQNIAATAGEEAARVQAAWEVVRANTLSVQELVTVTREGFIQMKENREAQRVAHRLPVVVEATKRLVEMGMPMEEALKQITHPQLQQLVRERMQIRLQTGGGGAR
jgi:hypothetical protein